MHRSLTLSSAAVAVAISLTFGAATALASPHSTRYIAGTPVVDTVTGTASNHAPWTLSQGDLGRIMLSFE